MKIRRYNPGWEVGSSLMVGDTDGEWVRWEDVKEYLKENRKMSNVFCMKCGRRITDCVCDFDDAA
jgi:hypothetical protein